MISGVSRTHSSVIVEAASLTFAPMTSELELRPLTPELRPVIERLWQLYRHDLSEFRGTHEPSGFRGSLPERDGAFHTRGLVPYLDDDVDRAAYVFHSGTNPVGFAFISGLRSHAHLMSEFFVVRGLRGHGLARAAVDELFSRHPGEWEIPFQENNVAAARFWRRVAAEAGKNVREELRPVPGKPEVPPDVWITLVV
jgi:predicted acetyltransferase